MFEEYYNLHTTCGDLTLTMEGTLAMKSGR
jgi:hypothetical protein